ncbi:tyrosine 3-monooxygenase-like [Anneissia japonica]|uniref:tyrosine 3-monooxygenase-like n=1 Tax=Anneissia japonica TaxID=1529436 RepID=UPI001425A556|nr:tyrosine 3-monooxygenase-like [Anneissia japonica]
METKKSTIQSNSSFDAMANVYPTRKQSLIEDAHRDSVVSNGSVDLTSYPSCESDDVFPEEYESEKGIDVEKKKQCITFSAKDDMGFASLTQALKIFEKCQMNVTHVESRKCRNDNNNVEFLVECETRNGWYKVLPKNLKKVVNNVTIHRKDTSQRLPWFPRKTTDLDKCNHLMSHFEPDLDHDHPGFSDKAYRERRTKIADIAFKYRHGQPIPRVEYSEEERSTWKHVYTTLSDLFPTHACKEHIRYFKMLEKEGVYSPDRIPQLEDVSNFLKSQSGFQLRPVAGLLTARDFLASLAFRVFQCTQYVRHHTSPMHTPEPDCCHELLGHVPMLADPEFAQFSQEIGIASLGVSDEDITKLATLYWFTVEFGLCRQDGQIKAYGAGLLSAYGELQFALSDQPEQRPFDPSKVSVQEYQDQTYQPIYYVTESFEKAKAQMRKYVSNINKPLQLRYNPFTQSIEVLEDISTIRKILGDVKNELDTLLTVYERLV